MSVFIQHAQQKVKLLYFQKASAQNLPKAHYGMATASFYGLGIAKDIQKSIACFHKAAEEGLVEAKNDLALLYYQGLEMSKDIGRAIHRWKSTAEQGDAFGQFMLGTVLFYGEGIEQNQSEDVQ